MSSHATGPKFKPNEFDECLIVMCENNPTAFARFGSAPLAAILAFEKAKGKAGSEHPKLVCRSRTSRQNSLLSRVR